MKYTPRTIKNWDVSVKTFKHLDGYGSYAYIPARPVTYWKLLPRLKLAFYVFIGRYDMLDWEDDHNYKGSDA